MPSRFGRSDNCYFNWELRASRESCFYYMGFEPIGACAQQISSLSPVPIRLVCKLSRLGREVGNWGFGIGNWELGIGHGRAKS